MTSLHLTHRHDPASSHEAAARHEASGARATNKERVRRYLETHPNLTSREYAEGMGMDVHEVRRRLTDLLNDGDVRHGPARKCGYAYTLAVTWQLAGADDQLRMF
jgi:transcription initiation factor IIE alpha subunit